MKLNTPKATFAIGLPRCGSLALSLINNTSTCVSHHEGGDYGLIADETSKATFEDSFAYRKMTYAFSKGMNYACWDISCYDNIIASMVGPGRKSTKWTDMIDKGDIQFIYIESSLIDCFRSLSVMGVMDLKNPDHKQVMIDLAAKINTWIAMLGQTNATILHVPDTARILYKDNKKYFSRKALINIGEFTGAAQDPFFLNHIHSLQYSNLSMNKYRIIDGGEQMVLYRSIYNKYTSQLTEDNSN